MRIIIFTLFILLIVSCERVPENVKVVLDSAGCNQIELNKVIDHYKSEEKNSEKLEAAFFLIGNMDDKFALDSIALKKYDFIFSFFGDLRKKKMPITNGSPFLKAKWDSLTDYNSNLSQDIEISPDYKSIKAEFLIKDIDLAFAIRDSVPWGREINFKKFCEYVLSYRFSNEPIENWRSYYYEKYKLMRDTLNADSCFELAKKMHFCIPELEYSPIFNNYPFDYSLHQRERARIGTCTQVVNYQTMVMRSAGLPVAIDYTPNWGSWDGGHSWNTLIMGKGKTYPFEGNLFQFGQVKQHRFSKVYRKTFGRQKIDYYGYEMEIPSDLLHDHTIDVTTEYTKTCDFKIQLRFHCINKKYVIICSSSYKNWVPQDWGEIRGNKAYFRNMGVGNLYLAMYYKDGTLYSASDPFILNDDGKIEYIPSSGDETQDMLLLRKYPIRKTIQYYHDYMINGSFQGANDLDFKDSINLFTVTSAPTKIETAEVKNPTKIRYVRFRSPNSGRGDIAEMEFYEAGKKNVLLKGRAIGYPEVLPSIGTPYQNASDGDIDTYFNGYDSKLNYWAGIDFGKPKRIGKIRYCPRSDTNFIVEGDRYELCYWKKDGWFSIGKQVAKNAYLNYENVPAGRLYILHNLSRGKQERIFTYENGKQIFW